MKEYDKNWTPIWNGRHCQLTDASCTGCLDMNFDISYNHNKVKAISLTPALQMIELIQVLLYWKCRNRHRTVQEVQERRAEQNERTTENDHIQPTNANTNTNERNATSSDTQLCRPRRHPELKEQSRVSKRDIELSEHVLSSDADSSMNTMLCENLTPTHESCTEFTFASKHMVYGKCVAMPCNLGHISVSPCGSASPEIVSLKPIRQCPVANDCKLRSCQRVNGKTK